MTTGEVKDKIIIILCGSNSVVEFLPSKQAVAGSSPVSRSIIFDDATAYHLPPAFMPDKPEFT